MYSCTTGMHSMRRLHRHEFKTTAHVAGHVFAEHHAVTVHPLHVSLASDLALADSQVTQNIACVFRLYFVGICYIAYSPADCRPSRMQKLQQRLPLLIETVQSSCLLGSCTVSRSATTRSCSVGPKLPLPSRGNKKSMQPGSRHCKIRCASKGDQACCVFCTLFCTHTMSKVCTYLVEKGVLPSN